MQTRADYISLHVAYMLYSTLHATQLQFLLNTSLHVTVYTLYSLEEYNMGIIIELTVIR